MLDVGHDTKVGALRRRRDRHHFCRDRHLVHEPISEAPNGMAAGEEVERSDWLIPLSIAVVFVEGHHHVGDGFTKDWHENSK